MSHFTVLVIGDDYEKQLEPFWELDLNREDMLKDPRASFKDQTEEFLEEYNNGSITKIVMPDGRMLFPWNEEFQVQVPRENGNGYTTKKVIPEDAKEKEIQFKDLYNSFDEFVKKWHGYEPNPDGQYGYYHNPNAKWDWYSVGGRWDGYFKLKEGASGLLGDPGIFGRRNDNYTNRADQAKKGDIDFETMRMELVNKCLENYDLFYKILNGRDYPNWDEIVEKHGKENIKEARDEYYNHPVMKDLFDSNIASDFEHFLIPREEYKQKTYEGAITTYAVVKDGKWYERGEMGWWGISTNEKDESEWNAEFYQLLESLPDDTMLTLVDCHI